MLDKFLSKYIIGNILKSKKFWYTVIGVLTTVLSDKLNLNPDEVQNILISIAALVLGQGFADMKKDDCKDDKCKK
tara:strand:- start:197 stop:421 length:225 start_codon:yes stop_codon:yes gene_type:complete